MDKYLCKDKLGFTEWLWENDFWLRLYFLVNLVPADMFAKVYILEHYNIAIV